jgi:hypothetical protein
MLRSSSMSGINHSRRNFLATAGLGLPAAGIAASSAAEQAPAQPPKLMYRTLGNTGLKVTALSFGCMTTSDETVIRRAADQGIIHFDTARSYQSGNNERRTSWTPACANWARTTSTSGTCTPGAPPKR